MGKGGLIGRVRQAMGTLGEGEELQDPLPPSFSWLSGGV